MKKLVLLLLLVPMTVSSQTNVNNDSLLFYFKKIVNQYRFSNGVKPLSVDTILMVHTGYWAKKMAKDDKIWHGSGQDAFQQRIMDCNCFPAGIVCAENCTELYTPDAPLETEVNCNIPGLNYYMKKSFSGDITQYELAMYAFLLWKSSPGHNATMLNPEMKFFHIYGEKKNGKTYLCYVTRS
jgi:uncharacterized protein YkwD